MIGIIPAAGYATRLGKIVGSKEMLEIDGQPIIEQIVRRMEAGGCGRIRVVTRPDKADVRRYAEDRGLETVIAHPRHLGESVGMGIAGLEDEVVALGFPDSLWEPLDGFARLREAVDRRTDVVLGLFECSEAARADVVVLGENGRVREILVKPSDPPSNVIWGVFVARAAALSGIEAHEWPSDRFRPLAQAGRVGARFLSDRYVDVGTPESLADARAGRWRPERA